MLSALRRLTEFCGPRAGAIVLLLALQGYSESLPPSYRWFNSPFCGGGGIGHIQQVGGHQPK